MHVHQLGIYLERVPLTQISAARGIPDAKLSKPTSPLSLKKKKKWHRPDIDRSSTDEERRGRNHGPTCGREARTLKEKKRKRRKNEGRG